MEDRELLELAARAAGMEGYALGSYAFMLPNADGSSTPWNPLTDDGDALRLAVKLGLVVDCSRPSAGEPFKKHHVWLDEFCDNVTATRRAIVRAAAEIGKSMP